MEDNNKTKEDLIAELETLRHTILELKASEIENRRVDDVMLLFSEANYSAIFNAANDAIFIGDIETGQIIDVNEKGCEMFCYPREEILNLSMADLGTGEAPYSREEAMGVINKAANGEPQLFEWLAKDKAERCFWGEINLKRAVIGGKYRLLAIVRDITERKRTEERLGKINNVFLNFGTDPYGNINRLTALCGELLGADCALYNRLEDNMLSSCGQWNVPPDFNPKDKPEGHICYDVIKRGVDEVTIVRNLPETEYAKTDPNVNLYKLQTYLGRVVKFSGKPVGSLCALYQYDYVPTEEDKKIIGIIAAAIGVEEERKNIEDVSQIAQFSIERAGDSIFWINKSAEILYVNDMACGSLGYSREELLNMSVPDIDPNFPREIWKNHWKEIKEKGSFTFETRHRRKDGTELPVEVSVNYMEFQGEEYNCAFARNITERKKQEEALLKRDYRLEILSRTSQHINAILETPVIMRTLVAAAMELVGASAGAAGILIDGKMVFTEYNKEGKLQLVNYSFESGHGVPGLVIKTMKPYISNDAAHDPHVIAEIQKALGFYNLVDIPIISHKGEVLGCFEIHDKEDRQSFDGQDVFMLQGLAASVAVALENAKMFAERKQAEESLQESERFLTNVFTSIQDGISILDKDMNIVRVNPVMEIWYSHSMPLVGKKCYEAYHRRNERCNVCPTHETLSTGKAAFETVQRIGPNGEVTGWLDLYSYPLIDALTGQLKGVIEYVRDITDRKRAEEALRENELQYRMTLESMADGIHVIDKSFKIILANGAMKQFNARFGFGTDMVGRNIFELYPFLSEKVRDEYKEVFDSGKMLVTEEANRIGYIEVVTETRKIPVFEGENVTRVVTIIRDVTDREQAGKELVLLNEELLKSNEKLKQLALKDIQTGLFNYQYLVEVIDSEFYRARRYGNSLSIIMLDIDYFKSINDVYGHEFGDHVLKQFAKYLKKMVRRYDTVIRFGGEEFVVISSGADRAKALMLSQRLLDAINLYNFGDAKHVVRLKVSIAVSSYPDDTVLKGLDLINLADKILNKVKEGGGNKVFSSLDIKKSKKAALEDIEFTDVRFLKEKIEKLTKRGKQNLIESITAFAKTIELRDHYTGEHVEHTVRYSTEIAKSLNLPADEIDNIRQASVLHDLGKIGISDKILLKRSKLTKKEFEEIKKHPQIAADIIRPIQFMHDIIPLVLYHHERWDGKGYPAGLKGEEIPMGARIIAISDVYQALTSNRPYRKAYSKKEAMNIIRKGAGTQFDPRIVDTFLKIVKKEA